MKESFGVGRALKRGHTHGLHRNTVMKIDYTIGTWLSSVFSNEWESLEICVTWDRSTCTQSLHGSCRQFFYETAHLYAHRTMNMIWTSTSKVPRVTTYF